MTFDCVFCVCSSVWLSDRKSAQRERAQSFWNIQRRLAASERREPTFLGSMLNFFFPLENCLLFSSVLLQGRKRPFKNDWIVLIISILFISILFCSSVRLSPKKQILFLTKAPVDFDHNRDNYAVLHIAIISSHVNPLFCYLVTYLSPKSVMWTGRVVVGADVRPQRSSSIDNLSTDIYSYLSDEN